MTDDNDDTGSHTISKPPLKERLRRHREPLDFSPSSTTVDPEDAAQDQGADRKTGRHRHTENATFTKKPLETTDKKNYEHDPRHYETLNELNRQISDTHPEKSKRIVDSNNDIVTWGRKIELSKQEIERAKYLFNKVNPKQREHGNGVDSLILAALTMAANEKTSYTPQKIIRASHASIAKESDDLEYFGELIDNFESVKEYLNVTESEIKNSRQYIRKLL